MTNTTLRPTHDTHGLVHPLPEGPLDFVADIHGEIEALRNLLKNMGYDESDGSHPEGRCLVFLGDLVDRGPDSPEVVKIVRRMIEAGNAQAVMGNHELNILLNKQKKTMAGLWATRIPRMRSLLTREIRTPFMSSSPHYRSRWSVQTSEPFMPTGMMR